MPDAIGPQGALVTERERPIDLADLLSGRDTARALLPACRLDGFGARIFGRDAVLSRLRQLAPTPSETMAPLLRGGTLAWLAADGQALFADRHEAGLDRLWWLGQAVPPSAADGADETELAVPADDFLSQIAADTPIDPALYPDLDPADAPAVDSLVADWQADALLALPNPPGEAALAWQRVRALPIRAVSAQGGEERGRGAVLLAIRALVVTGARRRPVAFHAASFFRAEAGRVLHRQDVVDQAGLARSLAARWTPRV